MAIKETPVETVETLPEGHVHVRITKKGADKVAKGTFNIHTSKYEFYALNDRAVLEQSVAQALEERDFVEIL